MIVCICHRVSDRDIAKLATQGATDLAAVRAATGLGSSCGKCLDCAQRVVAECQPFGASPCPANPLVQAVTRVVPALTTALAAPA